MTMPDPRTLVIALLAECHRLDDGTGIPGGWPLWADLSERMRRVYVEAMGNVLAADGAVTDAADRCTLCDRPGCTRDEWADPWDADSAAIAADCAAHEVTREQWRERAKAAERRAAAFDSCNRARRAAEEECERLRAIATEACDRARHEDRCNVLIGWHATGNCDCRVRDLRAALNAKAQG